LAKLWKIRFNIKPVTALGAPFWLKMSPGAAVGVLFGGRRMVREAVREK
jgi:hypothetical protein